MIIISGSGQGATPQAQTTVPATYPVANQPAIIVPVPIQSRLYFSIFHEADDDLLLGYNDEVLTSNNFAFAVPAKVLITASFAGAVRAISRSGDAANPITVYIREFF